ncbi:SacI homology domain-containing protein [Dipodascopsis tothii]|uniref:SacI homology domain-containing protein n=1 Tax=Dipodascopsis tothii TaxID=44089 RepID=UPI0034CE69DF
MSAPLQLSATASSSSIAFINNATSPPTILEISRPDGTVTTRRGDEKAEPYVNFGHAVPGILGIIRLRLGRYVFVITKTEKVGSLKGHTVYRIKDFEFIALREATHQDPDEIMYLSLIKRHIQNGPMFFSYTWDLTNAMQRQSTDSGLPNWKKADERFFWNQYALADLIEAAGTNPDVDCFILPVVYGFVSLTKCTIHSVPVTFGLISRRSKYRMGTRYFSRGIDAAGHVSNYNETEQLLVLDSSPAVETYSYVQTRGSVPVYWAEINDLKYKPKLRVFDSALGPAKLHFDEQKKIYGPNYCVNLVNQKGHELPVKAGYEALVTELADPDVVYVYFDFHHECRGMRFHRVQGLLDRLVELGLGQQGWFRSVDDVEKGVFVTKKLQTSVVRTNCMDCLDRTNVVQSFLASWVLNLQLIEANILSPEDRFQAHPHFDHIFRNVWADNADAVSKAYSGTGALKTDFTRLGKRTKRGALQDLSNSIERYARNNFFDGPRQDAADVFLGNHRPFDNMDAPFRDHRPIVIQSMPYVAYTSILMILATFFLSGEQDSWLKTRLFVVFWGAVFGYAMFYIKAHGLAYVNWPRLVPLDYVAEQEVVHAETGRVKGWVMSEKGKVETKIRGMEEGKKRTE